MAKDGSTRASEEERQRTRDLPHGSNAPANADTASGGPPEDADDDDSGEERDAGDEKR